MAFSTHDIVPDSPTNNFCTLNPLSTAGSTTTPITISDGNLKTVHSVTGQWQGAKGTISVSSGLWYFEVFIINVPTGTTQNYNIGFYNADIHNGLYYGLAGNLTFGANASAAQLYVNTSYTSYGSLGSNGSIYMFCLDVDSEKFWVGLNGSWFASGNPSTGVNPSASGFGKANWTTVQSDYTYSGNGSFQHNYGQDPTFGGAKSPSTTYTDANGIGAFYYQPPTDALALCTANLPDFTPTVTGDTPQEYFKAVTYTGNGTGQSITGVGFQPDLVWIKRRSANENHWLTDSVRGVTKGILSNLTDAEATRTDQIQSFDTDGFTLGNDGAGYTNASTQLYVSWCWKAGGAAVTNNDGSITSTVSANTDAGFSIVSYTGNATNGATVGHGLSQAPDMTIIKCRDSAHGWPVWHTGLSGANYSLGLEQTSAEFVDDFVTAVSSTTFTLGVDNWSNKSGENFIAYCWHSVEGYSKFGSYTGNGSADGPFVYCGFRPAWLMVKQTVTDGYGWFIWDTAREPHNYMYNFLSANSANNESNNTYYKIDFLSNGFKLRNDDGIMNASTNYIFMAFAEQPFKFSNAR